MALRQETRTQGDITKHTRDTRTKEVNADINHNQGSNIYQETDFLHNRENDFECSTTGGQTPEDELTQAIQNGLVIEPMRAGDPYHCTTCDRDLKTKTTIKNHLTTKNHREQQQRADQSRGGDKYEEADLVEKAFLDQVLMECRDEADAPFWCNVCSQSLRVKGKLEAHLKSKKHTSKVEDASSASSQALHHTPGQIPRHSIDQDYSRSPQYSYDNQSKGPVYVFNVVYDRTGADADSRNIRTTFSRLGYKVNLHEDFTKRELLSKAKALQKDETLKDASILIMCILCHGKGGNIFRCRGGETLNLDVVKGYFTDKQCPHLKGKPKIIFANFCRGPETETDSVTEAHNDLIIVYASNENKRVLRSTTMGTVFVGSLCKILNDDRESKLLSHICNTLLKGEMKRRKGTTPMSMNYAFKDVEI